MSAGRIGWDRLVNLQGRPALEPDRHTGVPWPDESDGSSLEPERRSRATLILECRRRTCRLPSAGVSLQPVPAIRHITEALDEGRPGWWRCLQMRAAPGLRPHLLVAVVAREARLRGFVPVAVSALSRWPGLARLLAGLHLLLLDEVAAATTSLPVVVILCESAIQDLASARPSDPAGASTPGGHRLNLNVGPGGSLYIRRRCTTDVAWPFIVMLHGAAGPLGYLATIGLPRPCEPGRGASRPAGCVVSEPRRRVLPSGRARAGQPTDRRCETTAHPARWPRRDRSRPQPPGICEVAQDTADSVSRSQNVEVSRLVGAYTRTTVDARLRRLRTNAFRTCLLEERKAMKGSAVRSIGPPASWPGKVGTALVSGREGRLAALGRVPPPGKRQP